MLNAGELEQLPIIYLGMRWITSRLLLTADDFEKYRSLFEALMQLMGETANLGFAFAPIDPWLAEHFSKQVSEKDARFFNFAVSFPSIEFGTFNHTMVQPQLIFDEFGLKLAAPSFQALATQLTKDTYSVILSLISSRALSETKWWDDSEVVLPNDEAMFLYLLNHGLKSGVAKGGVALPSYLAAARLLDYYLQQSQPPYLVTQNILSWGEFVVSTVGWTNDRGIPAPRFLNSYVLDGRWKKLQRQLEKLWSAPGEETQKKLLSPNQRAFQQVLAAAERIKRRSPAAIKQITIPNDDSNLYEIFQAAQTLFGWRANETFVAWGERLLSHEYDWLDTEPRFRPNIFGSKGQPQDTIEFPMKSRKAREILKEILRMWIEFHKGITEKNKDIAKNGGEENSGRKYDQQTIDTEIKKHNNEFSELVGYFGAARQVGKLEDEELVVLAVATMLTNVYEGDRSNFYHNVLVETEKLAEDTYRLALEVAIDQLIRQFLVNQGAENFMLTNIAIAKQFFQRVWAVLNDTGHFHGPELHTTGIAPRQWHYNAGIPGGDKFNLANSHIYFKR